jgi:pimeloyl-ACP methyl ester carboxylesterase
LRLAVPPGSSHHFCLLPHNMPRLSPRVMLMRCIAALWASGSIVGCMPGQAEVRFASGEVHLAGTIVMPRGRGPFPAVVFIHGSGPDSRENYRGQAVWFAHRGIAALIYDKRGVGQSTGDWRYVHFDDLADDALAAVRLLRSRGDIRHDRVGLWGGSNGGWVAPLAAARDSNVAFVITVSGAAWTPVDLAKWRSMARVREAGYPDSIVRRVGELMDLQAALIRRDGWEQGWQGYQMALAPYRNEPWVRPMSALRNALGDTSWFMPYTADIDFDPVPIIERVRAPMLALLGAEDPIVPAKETAARLRRLHKANLTVRVIEGANHSMTRSNTQQPVGEYWVTMNEWLRRRSLAL